MLRGFNSWSNQALTASLIGVAVLTVIIAVYVRNPYIKAGILAYEIFP